MRSFLARRVPPMPAIPIIIIAIMSVVPALVSLTTQPCRSQDLGTDTEISVEAIVKNYLAKHPEEIERIVRDYLAKHPEVVQASILQLLMRKAADPKIGNTNDKTAGDKSAAIKSAAPALFNSSHQVTLGNLLQGDVTLVEFFDYNCGYCKRALADMLGLLEVDPKLKIVLKEFPVLGAPSREAAQVAVAVRMQDATGAKYLAFHQKLLASQGRADKTRALEVAREMGLDMPRLEQDMASPEVRATLEENVALARELGINGTPGYVIGNTVLLGAVGMAALKDRINSQR
jgi:protein-disulfide isomerase